MRSYPAAVGSAGRCCRDDSLWALPPFGGCRVHGEAQAGLRCKHRGKGCPTPRRAAPALERAIVLGPRLIGTDEELQTADRRELEPARGAGSPEGDAHRAAAPHPDPAADLHRRRRKPLEFELELCYADKISSGLFAQDERRLIQTQTTNAEGPEQQRAAQRAADQVAARLEEVADILSVLQPGQAWAAAKLRRAQSPVEELLDELSLFPDHLEVALSGVPAP